MIARPRMRVRHGGVRGRAWLPVALRWRRREKPAVMRVVRTSRAVATSLHLHMHFRVLPIMQGAQSTTRTRELVSTTRVRSDRSSATTHRVELHHAHASSHRTSVHRHLQVLRPTHVDRTTIDQRSTRNRTLNTTSHAISMTHARVLHLHRQRTAPDPIAERQIPSVAAVAMRAPPLVWRTQADNAPKSMAASTRIIDATATPTESRTVAPPQIASIEAHAQRTQSIDPGLVERVTDDVIRRIDYRMRIERERRGL